MPQANESGLFYGPRRTCLLGRLRGWLIPVLYNPREPRQPRRQAGRGLFPAVGLAPYDL